MLGNFSFGDYFKKDAIAYAWELITSPEWFGIDKSKLYVSVFNGEGGMQRDGEAYDLWAAQGVPKDRIFEMGLKDNFWQMGDTGPCGPCSEIYYDMGPAASDPGHADCAFPCDCGRYVEIWNLVFMQFDRDASGKLTPLPKPSIDTGMGLERTTAVLQGVISNYDTDLFTPLTVRAAQLIIEQDAASDLAELDQGGHSAASLRVIADHARAATFLISDGVVPSNDRRGYVLRKIIRRAIRHGWLRGTRRPFLYRMVETVVLGMNDAYPELLETQDRVAKTIHGEEIRFSRTLDLGLKRLEEEFEELFSDAEERAHIKVRELVSDNIKREEIITSLRERGSVLTYSGAKAFRLYDTFGMPLDFMQDAARDQGIEFDQAGFDRAMDEQKTRARASWKGAAKQTANPAYQRMPKSEFEGYRQTRSDGCEVLAIIRNGQGVQELKPGEDGEVILDHTPFYAEAGGQVGDRGWLYSEDHNTLIAEVKGCYYPIQGVRAHQVVMKSQPKSPPNENRVGWATLESARGNGGTLKVGDKVDAVVNTDIRQSTMRNHTATHLLQAGLREVLGKHVKQAGSLVAPDHLRFDFSHFTGVADEELQDIEDIINKEVLRNTKIDVIENVPIDVAINEYHAMALFGEKYGDRVRVIKIGDFSTELCGGTHTGQTGEIGLIKILKEGSVSSGVRRVEAVTGEESLQHFRKDHELENVVSTFVNPTLAQRTRKDGAPSSEAESTVPFSAKSAEGWGNQIPLSEALKLEIEKKESEIKRLTRELDSVRMKSASSSTANIGDKIKEVNGVKVLAHRVDNLERAQLRTLVDQLRDKIGSGVVILGSATNGNVALIVGVTKDLIGRVQAGKVIGPVAQKVGGKGGGRPDLAEAGGKDASALDAALDGAYGVVEAMLA
jgi:alanyl-tRNA synthetase